MEDFFSAALGLPRPWKVQRVDLLEKQELFEVHVTHSGRLKLVCPTCGQKGPGYDSRTRRWRHLDACGYQTWLLCDVPRMKCREHGIVQVAVPWAEARSRFTAPFECSVIDWLRVAPIASVAKLMRISWNAAAGIEARAVARGLERRGPAGAERIGADETSFRLAEGNKLLVGSKFVWLQNRKNMKPRTRTRFKELQKMGLKVGRACAVKEAAQRLWHYKTRRGAAKAWLQLRGWAQRTRLKPIIKVGRTIRRNLLGILNAIVHGVTNASAEGMNSQIQALKKRAHGYRSEESFIAAIYFHLGGLDLYPRPSAAHTDR